MKGMRRFWVATAAAALLAPVQVLPAAHAAPVTNGPFGFLCGFTSATDPGADFSAHAVELDGGPLVMTDLGTGSPLLTATGTLRCSVQVDAATHGGADSVVASAFGAGIVTVPPVTTSYRASWYQDVYLCTEVAYTSGHHLYLDGETGEWSTSSGAGCDLVIAAKYPDPGPVGGELDPINCAVLATLFPPEGDVVLPGAGKVWDCPPYDARRAGAQDDEPSVGARRRAKPPSTSTESLTPYYPTGTIEVRSDVPGSLTYGYTAFNPPRGQWNCTEGGTVVSCTPPPPPAGTYNVCAVVGVHVTNGGGGGVSGSSHCATGPAAFTTSFGPTTTPSSHSASAYADFPWTCEASPSQSLPGPWTVRCTLGH